MLSKALLGESIEVGGGGSGEGETSTKERRTIWSAPEYEAGLTRALKIPTCLVVPFFGAYIRELRNVLQTPSLVVVSTGSEQQQLQVGTKEGRKWVVELYDVWREMKRCGIFGVYL